LKGGRLARRFSHPAPLSTSRSTHTLSTRSPPTVDLKCKAETSEYKETAVLEPAFFETIIAGEYAEHSAEQAVVDVVRPVMDLDASATEVPAKLIVAPGSRVHFKCPK
jgi:hypothetical protein